jgi:predicted small integral membrane protein
MLGSTRVHLAWHAFVGPSLWGALVISILFAASVFRSV